VRLEVADNGPGIPASLLPSIFDHEVTTKDEGTGEGLPFCKKVFEEADGRIVAKSTIGEGTVIAIFVPATEDLQEDTERSE
jgi:signal transduction histidine kinase